MPNRWNMERAVKERPPTLHPLAGASLGNYLSKVGRNGPYDSRSRIPRVVATAANLLRFPLSRMQALLHDKEIFSREIQVGPIFVVGHWRSGTTHLHNILSADPQFGWISFIQTVMPWDMLLEKRLPFLRSLISRELPEKRGTDNVALSIDSPQEEEWALANLNELSFFNCYYFPQNYEYHFRRGVLLENVTRQEKSALEHAYVRLVKTLHYVHEEEKPLLFKNPSATARMPMLKKLFPNAKFVHIVRNPYSVFASSLARYPRLMSAFSWQEFADIAFEDHTKLAYESLMRRYLKDRELIPPEDLVETSYEALTENPLREVTRIYEKFEIPFQENSLPSMQDYLETLSSYQKNTHQLTQEQVDHIRNHWQFALEEWGYEMPGIEVVP